MTALVVSELSQATIAGAGVFDVLMRAVKAHLEQEFVKGRIKGPEYATVYLGSMDLAMQQAVQFLLQQRKNHLEAELLEKQILLAEAQRLLVTQQTENAVIEGTVLSAQECKLRAEFDLTQANTTRTNQEITLLTQKTATEKAQTQDIGVDADSVIGRQKGLYLAQANGFSRDAEQKAAKLFADTWSVRRTTDEATSANVTNKLDDATVGRAMVKLLEGVGA